MDADALQFSADLDLFFDALFDKVDEGKISLARAEQFFPAEVIERNNKEE